MDRCQFQVTGSLWVEAAQHCLLWHSLDTLRCFFMILICFSNNTKQLIPIIDISSITNIPTIVRFIYQPSIYIVIG